jgi:hypothetical protein
MQKAKAKQAHPHRSNGDQIMFCCTGYGYKDADDTASSAMLSSYHASSLNIEDFNS